MDFVSKNQKGFTIIELVISIFILSIAIIGIFSAFSMITILTSDSADRLTATYLAQEGIEIVRNVRDTNWLNMDNPAEGTNPTWTDGLSTDGVTNCTKGCEVDYTTTGSDLGIVNQTTSDYLRMDSNGFYSYQSCPVNNPNPNCDTKFKRIVTITPIPDVAGSQPGPDGNPLPGHILKVTVKVSWDKKATVLNGPIPADSPDPSDPLNVSKCDPSNCVTAEETLYDWYNSLSASNNNNCNENEIYNPDTQTCDCVSGWTGDNCGTPVAQP